MRFKTGAPMLVPHKTCKDVYLSGTFIPKGTDIIPNVWSVHYDASFWGDQEKLRPERFLDDNGELLPASSMPMKRQLAFSSGP